MDAEFFRLHGTHLARLFRSHVLFWPEPEPNTTTNLAAFIHDDHDASRSRVWLTIGGANCELLLEVVGASQVGERVSPGGIVALTLNGEPVRIIYASRMRHVLVTHDKERISLALILHGRDAPRIHVKFGGAEELNSFLSSCQTLLLLPIVSESFR